MQVQPLEAERGDVLQVRPVVDFQASQVGQLAKVLILERADAQVTQVKGDQAAQVRQRLSRDGCQVAALYCEDLKPQQARERLDLEVQKKKINKTQKCS